MKRIQQIPRVVFAMAAFSFSFAQAEEWRPMPIRSERELKAGRYGGEGEQLFHGLARCRSQPDYIYLNQDVNGVWRSSDGGVTWDKTMDRGLFSNHGWSIAVDPVNPQMVLALQDGDNTWYEFETRNKGIYRSVNGGDDWVRVLDVGANIEWDFDRKLHHSLAYDPASVDAVGATRWYLTVQSGEYTKDTYQSTNTQIWTYGGVYLSEDRGQSWTVQNTNMQGYIRIDGIYVHPTNGNLYLASNKGLSISTNWGVTFSTTGDLPADYWVSSVAINLTNPGLIYAYAYTNEFFGEKTNGVYNAGVWSQNYGKGLYKSTDGGEHFSLLPGTSNSIAVFMNAGNPDILYLNADGSLPKISMDGGSNWTQITVNSDLYLENRNRTPMHYQSGFAASAQNPNDVMAFGAGSIHRSTDGGRTFNHTRTKFTGFAQGIYESGFMFDAFDPNRFAIGLSDVTMIHTETAARFFTLTAVAKIHDWYYTEKVVDYSGAGGAAVTNRRIPWFGSVSGSFHPAKGSKIIVASVGYVFDNYLMRSADNGLSWELYRETPQGTNSYGSLARLYNFIGFDRNSPDTVYAGDKVSFDTGMTWQTLPTGITSKGTTRVEVLGLCYSPSGTVVFGVGYYNKIIYRSSNPVSNGWEVFFDSSKAVTGTWQYMGVDRKPIVGIHPTNPNIVCVPGAATNQDVVVLTRSGTNTSYRYTGLIGMSGAVTNGNWVNSITFDPRYPEVMYASFGVSGLPNMFRSVDGGTNWVNIDFNRPLTGARTLSVSPYSGELLSGSLVGTWVLPPPYAGETPIYDKQFFFGPICTSSVPPSVPSGLGGSGLSESAIKVTWSESVHTNGGIMYYNIARDGQPVATAYVPLYTDTGLKELKGYDYTVCAVSLANVTSAYSAPITLSTLTDTNPPVLLRALNTACATQVRVEFDEILEPASAENPANYSVDGGVTVLSADLVDRSVILTTTAMPGGNRTLTVNGVRDASGTHNVILTNSQVVFTNFSANYPNDPMAWWPFNGSANDAVGTNHGAWINGAAAYTTGVSASAIALDGTTNGAYVRVNDSSSLKGMAAFTVSVSAKKNNPLVGGQLFKKHVTYDLEIVGTNTFDSYVINNSGTRADADSSSLMNIMNTAWHHYALVYDGTNVLGYVDGVEAGRDSLTGITATNAVPFYIGKDPWGSSFAGSLDEMKFFNRALSPVEISALFAELTKVSNPSDIDQDGLPNNWETQYFGGATNAAPDAICANGFNTVQEAYVAGFSPVNPSADFRITGYQCPQNRIYWEAVSGRLYSVYWTTNLLNGFQPLETNITTGAYTGATVTAGQAFYRIEVRKP